MIRAGLFTYHFSANFGALLQAYALRRWLRLHDVDAEFVNYHPSYVEEGGSLVQPWRPSLWRTNLKIIYLRLSELQRRVFGNRAQAAKFEAFRTRDLGLSGPSMETAEDVERHLRAVSPPYDLLVCGSDQIWNPSEQKGLDPAYFLAFDTGTATRRISYAPSFGRSTFDPRYTSEAADLLSGLDAISVREMSGVDIVRRIADREAACVPDPTILLSDYDDLLESADEPREGHVFCYALRTGSGIREVAELAGEFHKAPVLSPYNVHRRWKEIGETVYPSPEEWVALLRQAAFVVTNSFHGTVFSVLMRRPFVVVGLSGAKDALSDRARHLLAEIGLSDRFVPAGNLETARSLMSAPIDWDTVHEGVQRLRSAGEDYLKGELSRTALPDRRPEAAPAVFQK